MRHKILIKWQISSSKIMSRRQFKHNTILFISISEYIQRKQAIAYFHEASTCRECQYTKVVINSISCKAAVPKPIMLSNTNILFVFMWMAWSTRTNHLTIHILLGYNYRCQMWIHLYLWYLLHFFPSRANIRYLWMNRTDMVLLS